MKITPVILCGGSGTRLWPLSRQHFPKQFLKLVGDTTLFQESVIRAIHMENSNIQIQEILIVTNENHRFLVLEQLGMLKLEVPTRILLEPESRNTAPALTLAAIAAHEINPDSLLVVSPADHYIKDLHKYTLSIHEAIKSVKNRMIVTLGIKPTRPDTGFGYIHYGGESLVKNVFSFKEKPDMELAKHMIKQGQYAWNGGIFILQSSTWLDSIQLSNANIYNKIYKAWDNKDIDQWFERPNEKFFKESPSDSIDYSVMEKTNELDINVKLVILDAGWSDLGSFNALDDIEEKDKYGNIFKGDVVALNTHSSIAIATKKNVSLLGLNNLIVIEASDSILVANKNDAQSIKDFVKLLEKNNKSLLIEHKKVHRPWGWFETLEEGKTFKVKLININPGKSISLQRHRYRSEHWVVVKGIANITQDNNCFSLSENESIFIEKNQIHRIKNSLSEILQIIEVQTGEYLGEDDIERINDDYDR